MIFCFEYFAAIFMAQIYPHRTLLVTYFSLGVYLFSCVDFRIAFFSIIGGYFVRNKLGMIVGTLTTLVLLMILKFSAIFFYRIFVLTMSAFKVIFSKIKVKIILFY